MTKLLLASAAGGISFIVLFSVLTVVVFAAMIWLLCIGFKKESVELKLKPKYIFLILLTIGVVLRMVVAFSMRGLVGFSQAGSVSRTGYTGIFNATRELIESGFNGFLSNNETVFFYPVTMFILAFFGSICSLFSPMAINSTATLIFMKLPFIISDLLLALTIYKIAQKYAGEIVAMAIGGFVAVCPVFMLGAIWPSIYSFLALAFTIVLYFMLERKYISLVIAYTVSLLICFEAVYLFPVVAVYLIYAYVKKIAAYKKSNKSTSIWKSEFSLIAKLPVAIVCCIICSYLLILPFALGNIGANPFLMLYVYYLKPFNNLGYFTYNGLSLYTIFDRNGSGLQLSFPVYVFSILFGVAITAVTLIVYLTKKNRATFVMFVSYLLLTVNVYFVDSSELTLLPFLAAMLIAVAVLKDRRLLHIIGLMALVVFLNATGVLVKANYFGQNVGYVSELLSESWMALSILASVITVLMHIYYTFVLLDIVMNGHYKKLISADKSFIGAVKGLVKIKD